MRYKSLNKEFLDTPKETGKAFGTEKNRSMGGDRVTKFKSEATW